MTPITREPSRRETGLLLPRKAPWRRTAAVLALVGVVIILEILRNMGVPAQAPSAILTLCIIVAAFIGGAGPGLISAGIAWTYLALVEFPSGPGFTYSAANLSRMIAWGIVMPLTGALVGRLQQRAAYQGALVGERRSAAMMERTEGNRRLIVENAMDAVVALDGDGAVIDWNPAAERAFGRSREEAMGMPFAATFLHARSRELLAERLRALQHAPIPRGLPSDAPNHERLEASGLRRDGREFPLELSLFPLHAGGAFACCLIARDLSERWIADRRHEVLMRELDHRVKNNLAAMLSIVDQTAARSDTIDDFMINFRGRVMAMARLHSSLAASRWSGADLQSLVRQTVEPYTRSTEGRVVVRGAPVTLPAPAVSSVCMALHELATNASRYGALSVPDGRVLIEWRILPGPEGERLRFLWSEEGGPPVDAPTRYGFGRQLIEEGVRYEARGETNLSFSPSGVTCELVVPLAPALHTATP